jgi:AcrR family transcriptional regulator
MDDVKGLPRKERAARTRREVVRAAAEEFRASGYHGATMAAIARRAGVAVQTVYFVFHTKPLLLTAVIDAAVMGEENPVPPELTQWWQEGTTTADGRRALELFVHNVAAIEQRAAALSRVAATAALTDEDVVAVVAHHARLRRDGYRAYVEAMDARGLLAVDVDEANDVMLSLVGSEMFLVLTEDRRWSLQRYVAWTTEALGRLLLQ